MFRRALALEAVWPLAPGGVLVLTGLLIVWSLRGPDLGFVASPLAAASLVFAGFGLGHAARLAALVFAWLGEALAGADLFLDRAAVDLLDDESPGALAPDVRSRAQEAFQKKLQVELPSIARRDPQRVEKERQVQDALALARARRAPDGQDARQDAARGVAAALALSAVALTAIGAHDLAWRQSVAHALSGFTVVWLGLACGVAVVPAIARARAIARAGARDVVLGVG